MKILYIDTSIDGHHLAYLKELNKLDNIEKVYALPSNVKEVNDEQFVYKRIDLNNKKFRQFYSWMRELSRIAKKTEPDIIHFMMGDDFYKFFGLGLCMFKNYKTIATVHWIRPGFLQHLSLKVFSKKLDRIVVHSKYMLNELKRDNINNGTHIEYPQFKQMDKITKENAIKYWNLKNDIPVIVCIGHTRQDKGLDILLEALQSVSQKFQVLIAGKPTYFSEDYIDEKSINYSDNVVKVLKYLSDEEVEYAINAADIIVLPYRKTFNGASGPLGEGVSCNKCIIGSNHGNLGDTIEKNHLGYTFESENSDDLARVLNEVLKLNNDGSIQFKPDELYDKYKKSLDPKLFTQKYFELYNSMLNDK